MNRQDIQLLAAARAGDAEAHCRVGLCYLTGQGSFPRHLRSGIAHLSQPAVRDRPEALLALCSHVALDDLISEGLLPRVRRAASMGISAAVACLGVWWLLWPAQRRGGLQMLRTLAQQGRAELQCVMHADGRDAGQTCQVFWSLAAAGHAGGDGGAALLRLAWRSALGEPVCAVVDADTSTDALRWMLTLLGQAEAAMQDRFADLVVVTLERLERLGEADPVLPAVVAERLLARAAERADPSACFRLGRALSGIDCSAMPASAVTGERNLRRGTALLLRAADAGQVAAWMHLHRLAADHRCSVANPQMSRFFLEKAALGGLAEAQRRLGVLQLREARTLEDSESALTWLHRAWDQGDDLAREVMLSLVLPVPGADEDAAMALHTVQHSDPWLAARMSLARHFGLTRTEALAVDPARGERPWGLVVGPFGHLRQRRLAAARAVPAPSAAAMACLHESVSMFEREPRERLEGEGAVRGRMRSLRTLLGRHGIPESLFFAPASGALLDTLRHGSRWAAVARPVVQAALYESAVPA